MLKKITLSAFCSGLLLSSCAQLDEWTDTSRHKGAAAADTSAASASSAVLYVSPDAPADVAGYRAIYIEPANLANMQVIQPEGASADPEWWITEDEDTVLQRAIAYEYTIALTTASDFAIVTDRKQAQLIVTAAVVAVHPHETRASIAKGSNPGKGARPGGAITVSTTVINPRNDAVLVRLVGTRASDNVWAFNQVKGDDPAFSQVFASWGADIRRGILQLQGRPDPALPQY